MKIAIADITVPRGRRKVDEAKARGLANSIAEVGDALKELAKLKPASAHCVVTDPPYGLDTHRTREGGQDYAASLRSDRP